MIQVCIRENVSNKKVLSVMLRLIDVAHQPFGTNFVPRFCFLASKQYRHILTPRSDRFRRIGVSVLVLTPSGGGD